MGVGMVSQESSEPLDATLRVRCAGSDLVRWGHDHYFVTRDTACRSNKKDPRNLAAMGGR